MNFIKLLALIVLISLSSCGGSGSPAPEEADNLIRFATKQELLEALSSSKVRCDGVCPTNVAKLTFWLKTEEGYGLGVCSGTLVDSNYIVTNDHCIPDNLAVGSDCSQQIIVQFPTSQGFYRENINCKNVVNRYSHLDGEPDLAVLKIDYSIYNRKRTTLAGNQFHENNTFTAYTMNPSNVDPLLGVILKKTCEVSLNNLMTFEESHNSGNVLIYGNNCNVIGGNSGSGLFNSAGDLVGVIHQKVDTKELATEFSSLNIKYKPFLYMGIAANISCLKDFKRVLKPDCEYHAVGSKFPMINEYFDFLLKKNSLEEINPYEVKVVINNRLEVELSEDSSVAYSDSLNTMRATIVNLFASTASFLMKVLGSN